ncbi:MAG: glutaminyl-peptide cyclotransferase [Euzebya sp.]
MSGPSPSLALACLLLVLLAACAPGQTATGTADRTTADNATADAQQSDGDDTTASGSPATSASPATFAASVPAGTHLRVREIGRRPHDRTAFTQGLEFDGDRLFESRGLFATDEQITLTQIDPSDGSALREVLRDPVVGDYFAEGLTVVDDRLIQLTWRSNTALVYDVDTLVKTGEFVYEGEGWGICDQPDRLIMSNGTPTLTQRDLDTFEVLASVTVTLDGQPVDELNEIECVDGLVWANVWNTNTIVVIDPDTGTVVTQVDVSALADEAGRFIEDPKSGAVLNGIAYDPVTDTWLITGKQWPFMFEVEFDCTAGCDEGSPAVTPSHYVRPRDLPPVQQG